LATVLDTPEGKATTTDIAPGLRATGEHHTQPRAGQAGAEPEPTGASSSTRHKIAMLIAAIAPLVGVGVAITVTWMAGFMGWLYLSMLLGGCFVTLLGITVSYHRLLSHRSYDCVAPMRFLFTALGAMAVEGSPIRWCAVHRRHHQFSDHDGDPHSPHTHDGGFWNALKGFCYAHMGWLFTDFWSDADMKRYVPDLYRDPIARSISESYYIFVILSVAIPTAIGGLVTMTWTGAVLGALWGGLVRIFLAHHITWSVNSVCHVFGSRDFSSDDYSTNNAVCAILGVGEGWHNNHHAFPNSAQFGLKWYQFDMGWVIIRTAKQLGLAWNVKTPSAENVQEKVVHAKEKAASAA